MKVLHVNDYRAAGGCEVVVETTVSLQRDAGHDVELFTSQDVEGARRTPLSYIDSRRCRRSLRRVLDRFRPDIVHLHNFYHLLSPGILAVLGAERRREPAVVMTAHDYHLVCPSAGMYYVRSGRIHGADERKLGSLPYLLGRQWDHRGLSYSGLKLAQHLWSYRLLGRRSVIDRVLCPSRFLQGVLSRYGLPTEHVPYPAPAPMGDARKPDDELRIVFAGRIEREKGVVELLEHWPAAFGGRLTIVGEGSLLGRCRAVCARRKLEERVEFTGHVPNDRARSIIERSHVVVLPSLWVENHPVSLLEALTGGTNILVSNLGGMREIVEESGTGFVFDPDDPASLAPALNRITERFRQGTLNDFDASAFLADRSPDRYLQRVLDAYGVA